MNRDWRFFFGEPSYIRTEAESSDQTYRGSRAANARGAARRDFDDRSWEIVSLPHDFVALNGISETDAHGGEHFDFPMDRGSAWYRRYFTLPESDRDKRIVLQFEGMGTFCEVYVNSMLLKTHRTNGIGFDVDITDAVRFGYEQNVVAVHCDCHDFEAWYYEGGGITRNVWLEKTEKVAVDRFGTFVRTVRKDEHDWTLFIDTEVRNDRNETVSVSVISEVQTEDGNVIAEDVSESAEIAPRSVFTFRESVIVKDPALWSPKSTAMHVLHTEVRCGNETTDTYDTDFGIREIVYDKDHGMFINGEQTTIYGFANHMLYLGVGEAMTRSMCEYEMRTLRDMGSNGYRTAHSPHHADTMDYCDRYGQLVMDENRIFHSSEIVIEDVKSWVKRDRNHPSVCMWSVYNEEDFVTHETGRRIFRTLKEEIRKLDPTRPVTGATSYGMFSEGMHDDYDLFGFNHQTMNLDALHHLHPDKPIYCSEMIMPLGKARDFEGLDVRTGEDARQCQKEFMIGGFHFTAWAYGPERPEILGMEGTEGMVYHGFKAYLKPEEPYAKIWPGWDFPGKEGQEVELNLANNGDTVEIYVNGEKVSETETDLYAVTPVKLVYTPGEIEIRAVKDGKIWASDSAVTPGKPAKLELICENQELSANGSDAAIVSLYVTDADGNRCLREAGTLVTFEASEGAELITTNSVRDDLFQGRTGESIRVFDGKCQALYRVKEGVREITVRASSEGLEGAEITVAAAEAKEKQVPDCAPGYVNDWHISRLYAGSMDDETVMKQHSVERWLPVDTVGTPSLLAKYAKNYPAGTAMNYGYYTKAVIPAMEQAPGTILALRFEGIDGKADIYVTDGKKVCRGHHVGDSPWFGHYRPELIVPCEAFAPGDSVEIWVMMHDVGRVNGIGWPVHWLYTTEDAIRALDEKTAREWKYYKYRD